jgi:quercetin dioxygenase-like cupin family protein
MLPSNAHATQRARLEPHPEETMPDATDRSPAANRARARNFSASHAADSPFEPRGLRDYFEYRDLGIAKASKGQVVAHVIRARPGKSPTGEWHMHDCDTQFYYVLKGWIRFEYEGVGVVTAKAGSCVWQPPGIRHRELAHSKNVELIEVVSPAKFRTLALPEAKPATSAKPRRKAA